MKNHLFIGLGGQGGMTIAALRKVLSQRESDTKALKRNGVDWKFLYIDSSRDVQNHRDTWRLPGKDLKLADDSFLYLKEGGGNIDPDALALERDIAPWLGAPARVRAFLDGAQGIQGANQRRRFGRLLFAKNADRIRRAIVDEKVASMTQQGNQCAFHIFASLAGGTGSGSIIDLVTMLRKAYPEADTDSGFPIFLYAFVTSDEFEGAQVGYFHQNQFAALRDLNALACSKLKPTILGSSYGGQSFDGEAPITQIVLSTSLNDRNQRLPLERQHRIVAEGAFERIFCYCNGDLNATAQKPLTGEDILPAFPGEPLGRIERSFRFGSIGMRRWEVPIEEIRKLLANALYSSVFRQLLYQNWNDGVGYLNSPLNPEQSGIGTLTSQLRAQLSGMSHQMRDLPALLDDLGTELKNAHTGIKNEHFRGVDLDDYEERLRERYATHLRGLGAGQVVLALEGERNNRVNEFISSVHSSLKAAWMRSTDPVGLAYFPKVLLNLQDLIRNEMAQQSAEESAPDEPLRRRMAARNSEWTKVTKLSGLFKRLPLADAHRSDLTNLLAGKIRRAVEGVDRKILDLVIHRLGELEASYLDASKKLEELLAKAEEQKLEILQHLRSFHHEDIGNKYELSDVDLNLYLETQAKSRGNMQNAGEQLLNSVIIPATGNENLDALGSIAGESQQRFMENADELIYKRLEQIHDALVDQKRISPVLTSSIMATLSKRFDKDPEQLSRDLKDFIDKASCGARTDDHQSQPKAIRGDANMPRMPKKVFVLGLPREPFSEKIKDLIEPLIPSGDSAVRAFYSHDERSQVRLLVMTSWMAARFASVTSALESMYSSAVGQNHDGDVAYFTNIDSDGQADLRPNLLLPTPAQSRILMRASLWLGQKTTVSESREPLVKVSEHGVSLIASTNSGLTSERLGNTIREVSDQSDIGQIMRIAAAVSAKIADLDGVSREGLRAAVKEEDKRRLVEEGVDSEVYRLWSDDREQILKMLEL